MKRIRLSARVCKAVILCTVMNLCVCGSSFAADHAPHHLVVGEGFVNPIGFHDPTPTFSWQLPEGTQSQSAYQIKVGEPSSDEFSSDEFIWDSGWVESDQSVFVPYEGPPLTSRQQLDWSVRFRDQSGAKSEWSSPARFELGLLTSDDWQAQWIGSADDTDSEKEAVAYLRNDFSASAGVQSARLYVTARGLYQAFLNGKKVGDDAFTPGWTSYKKRIDTQSYDVTDRIQDGDNALGAMLGYGWYAGHLGWKGGRNFYGSSPQLLIQLEITYQDGRTQTIVSDGSWRATLDGPIRVSSIYDGETYDARNEMKGWNQPGFDESTGVSQWKPVAATEDLGIARLTPKPFASVGATETLTTQAITEPEPGRFVFDLGQNMVGWPLIKIPVQKDQTIEMRFAEMLNQDGTMYTENYRTAKSTNFYTAAKAGSVSWQPTFTFHGFRYIELSGFPDGTAPSPDWVEGVVMHTKLKRIGKFESSHSKLNQLQKNITWGQRGNFLDIPTDCPQRDERMGWTGDAQAFCPTAMFNYDCHAFWKSWLETMRDDQFSDGRIPHVIPDALNNRGGSPGWMDAATIIPWAVYVRTGDTEVLSDNFEMMEKLVQWYRGKAKSGIVTKVKGFGDWLQPYADDKKGDTPHELLATAFYANSVRILADSASVLGKESEAKKYGEEATSVRNAFADRFFDGEAKLQNSPETQTGYLLAIEFGLIPDNQVTQASEHLVRLIDEAGGHLRTGFLGTPFIASVLERTNHADVAFSVLFKESYPSWFYSINQGATTMWERWNSYSHQDGFGDVSMNSFNHYAYGAIGQFMVEQIAGLGPDPEHPGYKHFFVQPVIGGPLTSANAELETPYGMASSSWTRQGDTLSMSVKVPPGTTATVIFPDRSDSITVTAGDHQFNCNLQALAETSEKVTESVAEEASTP